MMSFGICLRNSGQTSKERDDRLRTIENREKVVQELRSLDSLSRSPDRISCQKAILDFKAGKLSQAARELEPIHSAIARNALGVVLEAKGDNRGALAAFQEALQLEPEFTKASHNAAHLLILEGRYIAAISQIQSVLTRVETGDKVAYALRGLLAEAYSHLGQDEHAAEILNALSVEGPDSAQVRFSLGLADARLGRLPEAVKQFQEELRLKPNEADGLINLAKALLELRNYSESVTYLEEYIHLRPNDAQGYYALGYALQAMDRSKEAVEKLSHAARLSPKDYDIRFYLGKALWRSGRPEA
jgi:tetratricopeptide (TPR) repeat protein